VSSTGSDPTTTFVSAAELVAEDAEVELEGVVELLLELLQAVTKTAVTARPATATGTRRP
jgi:hypothetical protein